MVNFAAPAGSDVSYPGTFKHGGRVLSDVTFPRINTRLYSCSVLDARKIVPIPKTVAIIRLIALTWTFLKLSELALPRALVEYTLSDYLSYLETCESTPDVMPPLVRHYYTYLG